jgi:hypothetical protein
MQKVPVALRALSIRQPWCWAILHAGKSIENRDWHCHYRGPIWLHASKWWDEADVYECLKEEIFPTAEDAGITLGVSIEQAVDATYAQRGCIVGRATIVDCVHQSNSPWFTGPHGIVLADVVALPRVSPYRGALGLFEVPPETELAANVVLERAGLQEEF